MRRFELSEFKALREAGTESDDIISHIHRFYEHQESDIEHRLWRKAEHLKDIIRTACLWVIGISIFGLLAYLGITSLTGYNHYLHACDRGDATGCIALVHDNLSSIDTSATRSARQEIAHLKTAFRLKTGQDLPDIKE